MVELYHITIPLPPSPKTNPTTVTEGVVRLFHREGAGTSQSISVKEDASSDTAYYWSVADDPDLSVALTSQPSAIFSLSPVF